MIDSINEMPSKYAKSYNTKSLIFHHHMYSMITPEQQRALDKISNDLAQLRVRVTEWRKRVDEL